MMDCDDDDDPLAGIQNQQLRHLLTVINIHSKMLRIFGRLDKCNCKSMDKLDHLEKRSRKLEKFTLKLDDYIEPLNDEHLQLSVTSSGRPSLSVLQRQHFEKIVKFIKLQDDLLLVYRRLAEEMKCQCFARFWGARIEKAEFELNEMAINNQVEPATTSEDEEGSSFDSDDDEVEDDEELNVVNDGRLLIVNEVGPEIVNEATTTGGSNQQTESAPNVNSQDQDEVDISPPIVNYHLRDRNAIKKTIKVANCKELSDNEESLESSGETDEDDESDECQLEADEKESDEEFEVDDDKQTANENRKTRAKQQQSPVWLCDQLGCDFKTGDRLKLYQHQVEQHQMTDLAEVVCFDCGKRFKNKIGLKFHRRNQHSSEFHYQCQHPDCGRRFVSKSYFNQHKYSHNKEKKFKCRAKGCQKRFQNPMSRKAHFNNHHKNQFDHRCDHPGCGYASQQKATVRRHKRETHGYRLACDFAFCGDVFQHENDLIRHRQRKHVVPGNGQTGEVDDGIENVDAENIVNNEDVEIVENRRDQENIENNGNVDDEEVDGADEEEDGFIESNENDDDDSFPKCQWPGCEFKSRSLNNQSLLRHVKRMHKNEYKYRCSWPDCHKRFFERRDWLEHLKKHNNGNWLWPCQLADCWRWFDDVDRLKEHLKWKHW